MSAKRPRPAVPVLVHVDNPAEVGSVSVDTSTIEGKMDTVITNQNRIYDKIPTSSGGGGSADLTTVNANTTALTETIGSADSNLASNNLFGAVKNLSASVGDFNSTPSDTGTSIRSFLYGLRRAIGNGTNEPSLTGNTVRDLLMQIKTTTGPITSGLTDNNLLGFVKNISASIGDGNSIITANATHLRSLLYNIRETIGDFSTGVNASATTIRSLLYNLSVGVGSIASPPVATGSSVRDLLTAIKQNTASGGSGGGGGSADLTTVNEKTTALAAAIGSASDDSSTVSVIGLLKSITDKY